MSNENMLAPFVGDLRRVLRDSLLTFDGAAKLVHSEQYEYGDAGDVDIKVVWEIDFDILIADAISPLHLESLLYSINYPDVIFAVDLANRDESEEFKCKFFAPFDRYAQDDLMVDISFQLMGGGNVDLSEVNVDYKWRCFDEVE